MVRADWSVHVPSRRSHEILIAPKGTILFSNELARQCGDQGIVSISLYPGAINADMSGAATTFLTRVRKMFAAFICFLIQGGDLDAITDDVRHVRDGTFETPRLAQGRTNNPVGGIVSQANDDPLGAMSTARGHMNELAGASVRAITPLYAGTDPAAGELNGRVRYPVFGFDAVSGNINLPYVLKSLFAVSHRLGAAHTSA